VRSRSPKPAAAGAAVLALMPSHEPVEIGEHRYVPVLIPSAPVPFGVALMHRAMGRCRRGGLRAARWS
jgi:hypothetical protein